MPAWCLCRLRPLCGVSIAGGGNRASHPGNVKKGIPQSLAVGRLPRPARVVADTPALLYRYGEAATNRLGKLSWEGGAGIVCNIISYTFLLLAFSNPVPPLPPRRFLESPF